MKKTILLIMFLFSIVNTFAQGGPDAFGYTWRDSNDSLGPHYNWIDITTHPNAVQVSGLTDDNTVGFFPVGFQFPYYWYTVSQFKIGSNGYMIFSNGAMASPFPPIPASTLPNDFIAAMMSDLNFNGAGNQGQCWYWSNQTDTLILSYVDVPFWTNASPPYTGANSFQIILSGVDSSITFQYLLQQGVTNVVTGQNHMSIGIENNSGAIGLQHSLNIYPPQNYAVKYYYPASSSFVVNDAAAISNNNPESGGSFVSKGGASFTMSTQVANTGNQSLNAFPVRMQILNSLSVTQVQETDSTTSLTPGQTQTLTATAVFNPVASDTYTFSTTTQLSGDATPSNNIKDLELIVVDTTQSFIKLGYTGDVAVPASTGISWTGGDAGAGVEIRPPFYPIYIRQVEFFITANANVVGMYAFIFDNTGPNNGPGTLLDSVYVPGAQVLFPDAWNTIDLTHQIQVDSGSVWVAWMMDGEGIALGTDITPPISNRTYEILGAWAIYRDRETEDLMIRLVTTGSATTGIENPVNSDFVGEFYPSPSCDKIFLNTDFTNTSEEIYFSFYNIEGQLVYSKKMSTTSDRQNYSLDVSKLDAGVYVCKITAGAQEYNRKLIIQK